jgi:hypothetical protein
VAEQRDERERGLARGGQRRAHQRAAGARALERGRNADRPEPERLGGAAVVAVHPRAADRHVPHHRAVAQRDERQRRHEVAVRPQPVEDLGLDLRRRERRDVHGADRVRVLLPPGADLQGAAHASSSASSSAIACSVSR